VRYLSLRVFFLRDNLSVFLESPPALGRACHSSRKSRPVSLPSINRRRHSIASCHPSLLALPSPAGAQVTDPVDHYSRTLTTVLDLSAAGFLALFFEYPDLFVVTRLDKHCLISDPPFFPHQAPGGWSFRPHQRPNCGNRSFFSYRWPMVNSVTTKTPL